MLTFDLSDPVRDELVLLLLLEDNDDPVKSLISFMVKNNLTLRSIGRSIAKTAPDGWKPALKKLSELTGHPYADLGIPASDIQLLKKLDIPNRDFQCIMQKWGERFKKIKTELNQSQVMNTFIRNGS